MRVASDGIKGKGIIVGKRIIIIEDEPLIALDLEEAVLDAGCNVGGIARTVDEGLALLNEGGCDGAVLDANLNGISARPLVEWLRAEDVPFIVVSGYTRDQIEFLDDTSILVGKPFNMDKLTASIKEQLNGS